MHRRNACATSAMNDYQSSVYAWGTTAHGSLGCLDCTKKVETIPSRLAPCCTSRISGSAIQVVAGNGFSTVVTDKWEAFSWGSNGKNDFGRRGISLANAKTCSVKKVQLENVAMIAHGICHSCAVTLNGEVYGWGDNSHGNLGDGNSPSNSSTGRGREINARRRRLIKNPRKIFLGDNVSKANDVACGEKQTCILKQNGDLLTMGSNDAGQLGIGLSRNNRKGRSRELSLYTIRIGVPFKEIACGSNHCAAISSKNGSIYTWGWGKHGRLGHGNDRLCNQPTYVETLSDAAPFATVACGSAHTLVATEDGGSVYGFGWNAHGQVIGTANKDHNDASSDGCLFPVPCLMKKGVVKLSCSPFHSGAITLSGVLYLWGMNEDGQCGAGHELPILSPSRVNFQNKDDQKERYVVSVSCGYSHTVCILSNCLPLEATDLISQLQKYPSSAETIVKFARYAMFRLRLSRLLRGKQESALVRTVEDTTMTKSTEKIILPLDDDLSSISSVGLSLTDSTLSDNPYNLDETRETTNDSELSQRLIEIQKMSDEDHRSSARMTHLRTLRERVAEANNLVAEKKRMQEEDLLSRKMYAHIKFSQKELKLKTKHKSKAVNARDARTNDQIIKAAQRLKMARERREQQISAKKVLPPAPVQRSPTKKTRQRKKKSPPLNQIADNEQKSASEVARLRRRLKLVRQRESRLKTKEKAEKEAAQLRQKHLKKSQEIDRLSRAERVLKLRKERMLAEEGRKLELARKATELQRLEDDLKLNERLSQLRDRNKENKENRGAFYDLNHWTKSLSGVT